MILRNAIAGALSLAAAAGFAAVASAQQQQQQQDQQQAEGLLLVAGTIDCRYQLRPLDTAICSTPVLAAMDIQMITLFNALNLLVKSEVAIDMAADQQDFLKSRELCGTDSVCIGQAMAERIAELDGILKEIASRGPY